MVILFEQTDYNRELAKEIVKFRKRNILFGFKGFEDPKELAHEFNEEEYREYCLENIRGSLTDEYPREKEKLGLRVYEYLNYRCEIDPLIYHGRKHQKRFLKKVLGLENRIDPKLCGAIVYPFFQIGTSVNPNDYLGELKITGSESIPLMYKQYFSFVPGSFHPEQNLDELEKFLGAYVDLGNRISELGIGSFALKSYAVLWHLIQRRENLIVYHKNPENGQKIRACAERTMRENGIKLQNGNIPTAGFDFSEMRQSYNKLIAGIVKKRLEDRFNPDLTHEQLRSILDEEIGDVRKLDPMGILVHYLDATAIED